MEMNQVLIEQGDLLYKYLEKFFWTRIGLSANSVIRCVCVVTLHDYTTDTNDNMTIKTDFHTEHINTTT